MRMMIVVKYEGEPVVASAWGAILSRERLIGLSAGTYVLLYLGSQYYTIRIDLIRD